MRGRTAERGRRERRAAEETDAGSGRGWWVPAVLSAALLLPLLAPRSAAAQGADGGVELEDQRVHGLHLRAPSPLESSDSFQRTLQKRVQGSSAIDEAQMYIWNGGNMAVSVVHFGIAEGAGYDLDRGLRGALGRMTRRLGGEVEKGPDAYSIRSTTVSGHPARAGSNRIQRGGGVFLARSLVTRAGRDVWVVTVFGVEGKGVGEVSDAVFESLSVGG